MTLSVGEKSKLVSVYQRTGNDTGSPNVQAALLTHRIQYLTEHFKVHKKDHHSRYGLQRLVNRRRKLLKYLKSKDLASYRDLIKQLGLRDSY